jgi:Concanavalin A-like lectin/glucanases superfamily
VVVPDSDSLDPLEKDITLRASLRVSGTTLNDDSYDIVRKGLARTPGGDYKMEISNASSDHTRGKLHCYFKGTGGTVHVKAPINLLDGNWHNLVCAKTDTSVVASVDGQSYAQPGSAGSISNSTNLMVGAKTANPFDDVFEGRIAFARISIAQ